MAKYDELSFKKAFAAARAELGKSATFTWKGKSYSTRLAEEPAKAAKKDVAPKTSIRPRAKPPTGDAMKGYRKGDITTTSLDNTRPTGRGDGSLELIRRTAENALAKAEAKSKPQGGLSDRRSSGQGGLSDRRSSGQGGLSDRRSSGQGGLSDRRPTVDSTAPRQYTTTNTSAIKIVRPKARPAGVTKPKRLSVKDWDDPQKRKENDAAWDAYYRSLKG